MVPESVIEEVINHFDQEEVEYVNALAEILESQPALLAFLNHESLDILMEDEKDILWYIVLILYTSIEKSGRKMEDISDQILNENEEKNWELLLQQPKGPFRDRLTPFFENYAQEDLLAFVEDTLELDDESPITTVGREVIFISSKSIIDTLLP